MAVAFSHPPNDPPDGLSYVGGASPPGLLRSQVGAEKLEAHRAQKPHSRVRRRGPAGSDGRSGHYERTKESNYAWRNVEIVGGGYVPGIVFNTTEPGLVYARTDIGGAYRWNARTKRWIPLLDWVGWTN